GQYSQEGMHPRRLSRSGVQRYGLPCLLEGRQSSGHWRPETDEQKESTCGGDQVLDERERCGFSLEEPVDAVVDQRGTETEPHEQQSDSGPAIWKGGE